MRRGQWLEEIGRDIRFGVRALARQPAWTAVGILTLALGIGANAAVFSVVNNLLLHPLPYPGGDRLAMVYEQATLAKGGGTSIPVRPEVVTIRGWRDNTRSFEDIQGFTTKDVTLIPPNGTPAVLHAAVVLPSFADFAGARPLIGRNFTAADLAAGNTVVVLSEGVWRTRFGADRAITQRTVALGDTIYQVLGVMPGSLRIPAITNDPTDIWLPADLRARTLGLAVIARLRPGVTYGAAARELDSVEARRLSAGGHHDPRDNTTAVVPPSELVRFHDSLMLLAGAAALVLIIACANVAHLLLARGATRQRELAIRAALGAGRGRLLRQLVAESVVLALAGCAAALMLCWFGLRALLAFRPDSLAQLGVARLDGTTLLVTLAVSLVAGVGVGVVAAWQSVRFGMHQLLSAGTLAVARPRNRLRSLLVVTEMGLSAMLLVGALLLVRTIMHLQLTDPGFRPAGLYAMRIPLPVSSYTTSAARSAFFNELAQRARVVSGVEAVTLARGAPPDRKFQIGALQIEGERPPAPDATAFIDVNGVRPDFFQILGLRLLYGTTFVDTSAAASAVIVNESLARRHWPGTSALGHRLRVVYAGQGEWRTIVGVVNDAVTGGLAAERSAPMLYTPGTQGSPPTVILRIANPAATLPALRAIVASMDRRLPPPTIVDVGEAMSKSIAAQRFTMLLLTVFTVLALMLAAVGLYGVMAYSVAQRTREIGIRVALGATHGDIGRAVVAHGLVLAASGLVAGLIAARWGTALLSNLLSGIAANDLVSFAIAAALLLATAIIACIVPMRRALAVEAVSAMRAE